MIFYGLPTTAPNLMYDNAFHEHINMLGFGLGLD